LTPAPLDKSSKLTRIGGEAALKQCIEKYFVKIQADDTLVPYFKNCNLEQYKEKLHNFLGENLGGPMK